MAVVEFPVGEIRVGTGGGPALKVKLNGVEKALATVALAERTYQVTLPEATAVEGVNEQIPPAAQPACAAV